MELSTQSLNKKQTDITDMLDRIMDYWQKSSHEPLPNITVTAANYATLIKAFKTKPESIKYKGIPVCQR